MPTLKSDLDICTVNFIDHVGIAVWDIQTAIKTFNDIFDIKLLQNIEISSVDSVNGALLSAGQTNIELLSPSSENSTVHRFLKKRGEGLHHLAFRVDNVKKNICSANALGLTMIDQEPRSGLSGIIAFMHPKSLHGVLTEFVQSNPQNIC